MLDESLRAERASRLHRVEQAGVSKLLAGTVQRLGDTVAEDDNRVTWIELDRLLLVRRELEETQAWWEQWLKSKGWQSEG